MIEVPKMPSLADAIGDEVPDLGPNPHWENNEELKKLNATMGKVLEQLTLMHGRLASIETNTRKSGFNP
jgi:hypothetical protein